MRARTVVTVMLLTLWPASAFAGSRFWAWLEELSGPGPFTGFIASAPVVCRDEGRWTRCWRPKIRQDKAHQRIILEFGRMSSDGNLRFKELPDTPENREPVDVFLFSGGYMFRFAYAFEAGPGVGLLRFSGKGFDPTYRATVSGRVAVRPALLVESWRRNPLAHVFRFEAERLLVTSGFTGADFGSPSAPLSVGAEPLWRTAFVVDFGELIGLTTR